ncbi:glycosyltransferase family 4 protein [Gelidibacter sp. F2691]|nr:glycosyltransferase family 4 protein [Gelidibacter sp. F2691]
MRKISHEIKRIGLVLSVAPGYSETFFRSKIRGLQASGHEVILFCSEVSHQDSNLCPIILMPKPDANLFKQFSMMCKAYFSLLPHFSRVVRFVRLERHDGVSWVRILKRLYSYAPILKTNLEWLHFGFGTLAIGAENLADAIHANMAVSFRGFDIGVYPVKHPNCYVKVWDKVSKIHVISDDIADLVYHHGFKGQVPLVKITPAIDTQHFYPSPPPVLRTPVQILTVARLHWKKGLNYTLEALALVKKEGLGFEYRIIGAGPEEEALKFAVYQLGLQDQVRFLGKLDPEAVKQEMEQANLYIQYSIQEGFCNAVLEAQAMGLLCVVSDAEGLAENILDKKTGWVVPKRQPNLLAREIKAVLNMPETKRQHIRNMAIKRVQNQFNLEKQQNEFILFYQDHY